MARKTKEQREAERAEMEALELAQFNAWKATLPQVLYNLRTLATKVNVQTDVELTPTSTVVKFYFDQAVFSFPMDTTDADDRWQLESVERRLNDMLRKQQEQAARRELAAEVVKKMTTEEREALREYVHFL
jgi:fructose/tagatose bisphosphate aldolase